LAVVVAVVGHHLQTRMRLTALVVRVEAALADPVAAARASCQPQVLRILDQVVVLVAGETPTLMHNVPVPQVQME
jgi:hypothetical protein